MQRGIQFSSLHNRCGKLEKKELLKKETIFVRGKAGFTESVITAL